MYTSYGTRRNPVDRTMTRSRRGGPGPGPARPRSRLPLARARVGFLAQAEVEELHLWVPWYRLQEEGATCVVVADDEPRTYMGAHRIPVTVDEASWGVAPDSFDGLV